MKLSLEDRAFALTVDGKPVAVDSVDWQVDGINIAITFRTTLGALDGLTSPQQERAFGGFREHEHVAIRFKPEWPIAGMAKIITAHPPSHGCDEATFVIEALGPIYRGATLVLKPGERGPVFYTQVEKHAIGVSS